MVKTSILVSFFMFVCVNALLPEQYERTMADRPHRELIAYAITEPNGNAEIFLMKDDGKGKIQLTNQPGRLYGPAFSPDATKIAFYNHVTDQTWSLYYMDADGTNIKRLTNTSNTLDWSPCWSSDGNQIVFARSYSSPTWRSEIWVMNADGSNLHPLGNVEGQGPAWSPDGSKIAYFSYWEGGGDIWVMKADGSNPVRMTEDPCEDWWPKFSPDGKRIVFQSKRDGNHEIYVMNADGSDPVRLTTHPADDEDPNWSPDGTKIAFISMRDGHYEIYTMNVDGSNQTRITTTNGHAIDPEWQPILTRKPGEQGETTREHNFPELKGPYLGQKPPGTTPEIFAPGIVSLDKHHDFKGAFSPDGKEYYFCRHKLPEMPQTLFFTKISNGIWTKPNRLEIAKGHPTFHPCITYDNQWLLFYWRFEKGKLQKTGYYASARTDRGWSVPRYAGQGMVVTSDNSGLLYATEMIQGNPPAFYIKMITFRDGLFVKHERLHIDTHSGKQTHPCMAPDGSYIIFDIQDENSKLFVCFRDKEGHWGEVIDLTKHGLHPGARGAYISPDGKYLFYGFGGDIWWVNIKVIEDLRPAK